MLVSSPPRRVLLLKANPPRNASAVQTLLDDLDNPSGLFLDGDLLYVAEQTRVVRVRFDALHGRITGPVETILSNLASHLACIGRER